MNFRLTFPNFRRLNDTENCAEKSKQIEDDFDKNLALNCENEKNIKLKRLTPLACNRYTLSSVSQHGDRVKTIEMAFSTN